MNDMIWILIAAVVLFAVMQNRRKPAVVGESEQRETEVIQQGPLTIEQEMDRLIASGDFTEHRQGDQPW